MRLFLALPISSAVEEHLLKLRLRLSTPKDGLRWSEPEQWHLTLHFLGEVDEVERDLLITGLQSFQGLAPELAVTQLGLFPAKGILYAEIARSPALFALYQQTEDLCRATGLQLASRPFHPHITLARSKGKVGMASLQRLSKPALPTLGAPLRWSAPECLLLQSTLRPQGAQYSVEARAALGQSTLTSTGSA